VALTTPTEVKNESVTAGHSAGRPNGTLRVHKSATVTYPEQVYSRRNGDTLTTPCALHRTAI
jgi:hypothetical protein